jgi:hypothetical protein
VRPPSPAAVLSALKLAQDHLAQSPGQVGGGGVQAALGDVVVFVETRRWTNLSAAAGRVQGARLEEPPVAGGPRELVGQLPETVQVLVADELSPAQLLETGGTSAGAAAQQAVVRLVEGRFGGLSALEVEQVLREAAVTPVVVVDRTRAAVERVARDARELAAEPEPAADDPHRDAWVDHAKRVLRRAQEVVTDILVAAAFCLPSAQEAARRAADLAGETRPLLPALLAVAIMGALGVRLARDLRGLETTG